MEAIITKNRIKIGTAPKKSMQAIYLGVAQNRAVVSLRIFANKSKSDFIYADLRVDNLRGDPEMDVLLYANIRCHAVGIEGHSAAFAQALDTIGIEIDTGISDVGRNAIVNAISAIMRALGHTEYRVLEI